MIYLLAGSNLEEKNKQKESILINAKKDSAFSLVTINDVDYKNEAINELMGSKTIFNEKLIVYLDNILEKKENLDFVYSKLNKLNESENIFIFNETKISKDLENKFKKSGAIIKIYDLKVFKKNGYNIFAITDALEKRDRKQAWILLQYLLSTGAEPEAITGMLFWKVKTMVVQKRYGKFSENELKKLSSAITTLYHDAHKGLIDFEIGLEQLILKKI
ncbi:MAG: hypothetical protein US50_C0037G0002 [Candidatus Nomurabacteria bacterium GW2011_GWB1_37_5]|uniref:DNA polymerase III delta N-terminal domain-containing protein n=1 Tax=Candidatus Nomurabacteria bacterium GW2011_GWB1_37_5 TaxID=1618742 RepID=A0A0G0GUU7_9BACT|nr:MAG: hypothetical protein US50_C0037G0002 [Candidatus Nomurabacteria bacterium GW2011_GWB1_37_5]